MSRCTAAALAIPLALLLAGCSRSDATWARYRAERSFWHARRDVQRMQIEPRLTTDADMGRAITAFRDIVAAYPATRWATPERLRDETSRDVATISGDALIAIGQLEEMRGDGAAAIREYERAAREYRGIMPVALQAALAHASALERGGNVPGATAEYGAIARDYPLLDPVTGEALTPVIDAPFRVAAELRQRGLGAAADSTLAAAEARALDALERRPRTNAAASALWTRIAQARANRSGARLEPALDALRRALALGGAEERPRVLMSMAELSLAGGQADSALSFARAARASSPPASRAAAALFEGRIWEQRGMPDSAIAFYGRMGRAYPGAGAAIEGRLRRAVLLEETGRWEEARGELRALAAAAPTQPAGFAALERIVAHHARLGERDLAEIEAQRAKEQLDRLIATYKDEDVLLRARLSRARILLESGNFTAAAPALQELWQRYPSLPQGTEAGLVAARLAESRLNDRALAMQLYGELAERASDPRVQAGAQAELRRLQGGRERR